MVWKQRHSPETGKREDLDAIGWETSDDAGADELRMEERLLRRVEMREGEDWRLAERVEGGAEKGKK